MPKQKTISYSDAIGVLLQNIAMIQKNKIDCWRLLFRIADSGHIKIGDLKELAAQNNIDELRFDIRRSQYLASLTADQKKNKKRFASKQLKSTLNNFCCN